LGPTEKTGAVKTGRPPEKLLDSHIQLTSFISGMTPPEKRSILQLLEDSLNNEKRKRLRRPQRIKAEVSHNSLAEIGFIENISPSGAFLSSGRLHPPGSQITLRFPILNFEFPVKLNAVVIWISQRGMGLKFKTSQKLDDRLAAQKLADALGTGIL
jgi:hypothetical protein